MDHQHVLRQAVFVRSSCHSVYTVLANREGWEVTGDLVPQEAPDKSRCWAFVYLYNVVVSILLGEKNLEAGAAGERDKWQKGPRGSLPTCPPPPPGLAWTTNPKLWVGWSLMVANDVSIPRECFAKISELLKRNGLRAAHI